MVYSLSWYDMPQSSPQDAVLDALDKSCSKRGKDPDDLSPFGCCKQHNLFVCQIDLGNESFHRVVELCQPYWGDHVSSAGAVRFRQVL